jgi:L-histidine N-alpha-methyltransferase
MDRRIDSATADHGETRANQFEQDTLAGLSQAQRQINPKYFYDARGSSLFDLICMLPEYYPTRAELEILSRHGADIASHIGARADLMEFGGGSLTKIRSVLDALGTELAPARYLPMDVSGEHLTQAAAHLQNLYPGLTILPVIEDYTAALTWPPGGEADRRRVGFFPGSSLGNFHPHEALAFLGSAATLLRGGGMLIGIDLVKDPATLHAAYNDAQGVTAAFNLNVLLRANRELGANFDPDGFAHYAFYRPELQRMEMHLVSKQAQLVDLRGRTFFFEEGRSIHTESSYKYTVSGFRELARMAGFTPESVWLDDRGLFSLHWLRA